MQSPKGIRLLGHWCHPAHSQDGEPSGIHHFLLLLPKTCHVWVPEVYISPPRIPAYVTWHIYDCRWICTIKIKIWIDLPRGWSSLSATIFVLGEYLRSPPSLYKYVTILLGRYYIARLQISMRTAKEKDRDEKV